MSFVSTPSLAEQDEILAASHSRLVRVAIAAVGAARSSSPGLRPDRVLEGLRRVMSLRQDIWDLVSSLAPATLEPPLAADLDELVGLLRSGESDAQEVRATIATIVLEYAPEDEARRLREHAARGGGETALVTWWESCHGTRRLQGAPECELFSARRWRRLLAAAEVRRGGGPDLIDASRTDVDSDARNHWVRENRSHPFRLLE